MAPGANRYGGDDSFRAPDAGLLPARGYRMLVESAFGLCIRQEGGSRFSHRSPSHIFRSSGQEGVTVASEEHQRGALLLSTSWGAMADNLVHRKTF